MTEIPEHDKTNPAVIKKYGGYGVDANGDGIADPFDIEDDIEAFIDEVETAEMFGIDFPNQKIKDDYIKCITHCLETLKPFDGEVEIEKELNFNIDDINIMRNVIKKFFDKKKKFPPCKNCGFRL